MTNNTDEPLVPSFDDIDAVEKQFKGITSFFSVWNKVKSSDVYKKYEKYHKLNKKLPSLDLYVENSESIRVTSDIIVNIANGEYSFFDRRDITKDRLRLDDEELYSCLVAWFEELFQKLDEDIFEYSQKLLEYGDVNHSIIENVLIFHGKNYEVNLYEISSFEEIAELMEFFRNEESLSNTMVLDWGYRPDESFKKYGTYIPDEQ
jgi:hypothetical protein